MITRAQQLAFIASVAAAARASQEKWGVPASITIAQAIQESRYGTSGLARSADNYFGIKARQGEDYKRFETREIIHGVEVEELSAFACYHSPDESFDAHGKLLATLPRYAPAMACADDPLAFAIQLQHCGYSTDLKYPSELAALIKQFDLTQYDAGAQSAPAASSQLPASSEHPDMGDQDDSRKEVNV